MCKLPELPASLCRSKSAKHQYQDESRREIQEGTQEMNMSTRTEGQTTKDCGSNHTAKAWNMRRWALLSPYVWIGGLIIMFSQLLRTPKAWNMRRWASFSPGSADRSLGSAAAIAAGATAVRCRCGAGTGSGSCCCLSGAGGSCSGLDAAVAPWPCAPPAWVWVLGNRVVASAGIGN